MKKLLLNLLLVVMALAIALLGAEVLLRIFQPYAGFDAADEMPSMRGNQRDLLKVFTVDPDFGFRPILGAGQYNQYGTLNNGYVLEKPADKTRLLFIGDSVTRRNKIVAALRAKYGDADFEYWNAGVESFNTVQEVRFFQRYNAVIEPDHVILTFHLNDFETTPVAFQKDGKLVVYTPNTSSSAISPWLLQHSYLYRMAVGVVLAQTGSGEEAIRSEVFESLKLLQAELAQKDIRFSVLLFSYLKPYARWNPRERAGREAILVMLKQLGIDYFDLYEVSSAAIDDGIEVEQTKGDHWHPNERVAELFAEYLYQREVLDEGTSSLQLPAADANP